MKNEGLRNNIWETRKSRINAEKRLSDLDSFVRFVNVYYSFFIITFSIFSIIADNHFLAVSNTFVSIALLISILYFNSLNYEQKAYNYRSNYTQLHKLELSITSELNDSEILEIKNEYCDLLNSTLNHIPYDYYSVFPSMSKEYRKSKPKDFSIRYYCGFLGRWVLKLIILLLPIAILILSGVLQC